MKCFKPSIVASAIAALLSATVVAQPVELMPAQDATVTRSTPTFNKGFNDTIEIEFNEDISRGFIQFDLSRLKDAEITESDISSAVIEMSVDLTSAAWKGRDKPSQNDIKVYNLNSSWQESSVSWDCNDDSCSVPWSGGDSTEPRRNLSKVLSLTDQKMIIDVKSDVADMLAGYIENHGWVIQKHNKDKKNKPTVLLLNSKESGSSPKLIINLNKDIDLAPPEVSILEPADQMYVGDKPERIRISYMDDVDGVDPDSLRVLLDGVDISARCQAPQDSFIDCSIPAELNNGEHLISVSVADRSGKTTQVFSRFSYYVDETTSNSHWVDRTDSVTTSVKVGIGTHDPSAELDIAGNAKVSGTMETDAVMATEVVTDTLTVSDEMTASSVTVAENFTAKTIEAGTSFVAPLITATDGFVTGPVDRDKPDQIANVKHVETEINRVLPLTKDDHIPKWKDGKMVETSLVEKMNNVGIGIDDPTERLHIDGNIRATGNVQAKHSALNTLAVAATATSEKLVANQTETTSLNVKETATINTVKAATAVITPALTADSVTGEHVAANSMKASASIETPLLTVDTANVAGTMTAKQIAATDAIKAPALNATAQLTAPKVVASTSITAPTMVATSTVDTPALNAGVMVATESIKSPVITATEATISNALSAATVKASSSISAPTLKATSELAAPTVTASTAMKTPLLTAKAVLASESLNSPLITTKDIKTAQLTATSTVTAPKLTATTGLTAPTVSATKAMNTPLLDAKSVNVATSVEAATMKAQDMTTVKLSASGSVNAPTLQASQALKAPVVSASESMDTPVLRAKTVQAVESVETTRLTSKDVSTSTLNATGTVTAPTLKATTALSAPVVNAGTSMRTPALSAGKVDVATTIKSSGVTANTINTGSLSASGSVSAPTLKATTALSAPVINASKSMKTLVLDASEVNASVSINGPTVKTTKVTTNTLEASDSIETAVLTATTALNTPAVKAGKSVETPLVKANTVNASDMVMTNAVNAQTVTTSDLKATKSVQTPSLTATQALTAPMVSATTSMKTPSLIAENVDVSSSIQSATVKSTMIEAGTVKALSGIQTGNLLASGDITTKGLNAQTLTASSSMTVPSVNAKNITTESIRASQSVQAKNVVATSANVSGVDSSDASAVTNVGFVKSQLDTVVKVSLKDKLVPSVLTYSEIDQQTQVGNFTHAYLKITSEKELFDQLTTLKQFYIPDNVLVIFSITNDIDFQTHGERKQFIIDHQNGKNIHIIGAKSSNLAKPEKRTITILDPQHEGMVHQAGIVLDGSQLGLIDYIDFRGKYSSNLDKLEYTAIKAVNNATVKIGYHTTFKYFDTPLISVSNSLINISGELINGNIEHASISNVNIGMRASHGGNIRAWGIQVSEANIGIAATLNGTVYAQDSESIQGNKKAIWARFNSLVEITPEKAGISDSNIKSDYGSFVGFWDHKIINTN